MTGRDLDQLCVNTIRFLAADAVQQAKSGHPGLPMGAAPMAYVLWTGSSVTIRPTRSGPIATGSSSPPATARCSSMRCSTSPATRSRSRS